MADRFQRRVVCAAIKASDGELLLGIRHYSPDMHLQILNRYDGAKFKNRGDEHEGFVDQWGVWMSREEAYQVALSSKQLIYPDESINGLFGMKLCSECLY